MKLHRFGWILLAASAWAQSGTEPHAKASDYPAHATSGRTELGAEYWVHGFRGHDQMFITKEHLVVEVAVYPAKDEPVKIENGRFSLRVNGKNTLMPQIPSMVAASLKYSDWVERPRLVAEGGIGGIGASTEPVPGPRFPGDNRGAQYPRRPETPGVDLGGAPREQPVRAEDVVVESALPEGLTSGPRSGFLYFAYRGKAEKIKSVELLFHTDGQPDTVLKLK